MQTGMDFSFPDHEKPPDEDLVRGLSCLKVTDASGVGDVVEEMADFLFQDIGFLGHFA